MLCQLPWVSLTWRATYCLLCPQNWIIWRLWYGSLFEAGFVCSLN
ncbi:hypothetical protein Nmel_015714 [Mimus melanotis]